MALAGGAALWARRNAREEEAERRRIELMKALERQLSQWETETGQRAPLDPPQEGRRHFFGNLTANYLSACNTLSFCSNQPPWLSIVTNSTVRVWDWASSERPVLNDDTHAGTRSNRTVRVLACASGFQAGCRTYPKGVKPDPKELLRKDGSTQPAMETREWGTLLRHFWELRLTQVSAQTSLTRLN